MVPCRVQLLDGTDMEVDIDKKAVGEVLLNKVCEKLNLIEKDYFGLTFIQDNVKFWLNIVKEIQKQIKKGPWQLSFELKFYPDPVHLQEEITRYSVFLQLRRDILTGKLPCSFVTSALLGAYAVQSAIGDYRKETHGDGIEYIKSLQLSKLQNEELLEKIAELHQTLGGQNPAEAELNYIDNAKSLALYGVHMHEALDSLGNEVNIGVCAAGLLVYKEKLRTHRYTWPKILKIRYKRNNFYIDIRPETNELPGLDAYKLIDVKMAKRLWRIAVEHHAFFRLREPEPVARSSFARAPYRYSGRTQYQTERALAQAERNGQRQVNRANAPLFPTSRSTDNLALGFSTERWEEQTVDNNKTATLDLRTQKNLKSGGSLADLDNRRPDSVMDGNITLLTGGYGMAAYQRPIGGSNAILSSKDPLYVPPQDNRQPNYYAQSQDAASVVSRKSKQKNGMDPEPNRYQPEWNSRPASIANSSYSDGSSVPVPTRRKHISSRSSQSSRVESRARSNGAYADDDASSYATIVESTASDWHPRSTTSSTKSGTRTYTAPDGSVITEYRTKRNGIIETHIEKRTRVQSVPEEDTVFYDRALAEAIHAVTDMDPELSVQKIEIHTRSEEV